jgi:glycosyltransferase involved in cell wall biosynthesis
MNVLLLSTSDIDGGAARAAYRLQQGLVSIGVNSTMLVRAKFSSDQTVITETSGLTKLGPPMATVPLGIHPGRERKMFSSQWFPDALVGAVRKLQPDVVNLHWVCNGYVRIESLAQFKRPLVWTLQDMWPMTGGCHYSEDCDRYTQSCGSCPQLNAGRDWDLSRWVLQRKLKAWQNVNLTIVAPSEWIAKCAAASAVFKDCRIEVIPFCLDTQKYKPIEKAIARNLLNLPQDKRLILFGALAATKDLRKGFHLLIPALQNLSRLGWAERAEVVIFGASQPETPVDLGFQAHYLGHLSDDISLALAYSAADVMIVPSMQESFGQTASEALACKTPVVAFDVTGLKDIVDHQQNGYLCQPFSVEDLTQGINWVLEDPNRHQTLCDAGREKAVKQFALARQAEDYLVLYNEIAKPL